MLGDAACPQARSNFKNTIAQVKRLLGRKFSDPEVQADIASHLFYKVVPLAGDEIGVEVNYADETKVFTPVEITAMLLTVRSRRARAGVRHFAAGDRWTAPRACLGAARARAHVCVCVCRRSQSSLARRAAARPGCAEAQDDHRGRERWRGPCGCRALRARGYDRPAARAPLRSLLARVRGSAWMARDCPTD
jgi:hypothetical protein